MVMPAIAVRTFKRFKDEAPFKKLLKHMSRKIQKIADPVKKARFVHRKIDDEVEKLFEDQSVKNLVKCKKGCSACCHTQVAVTEEEALVLVERIKEGVPIDWSKLYVQANTGHSASEFFKIPYQMRGCIFLDDKGECRVYEDRPSVCRTNYVVSDPKFCEVRNGVSPSVQLLNTFSADSWIYAFFKLGKNNGTLPSLIKKLLYEDELPTALSLSQRESGLDKDR